MRTCALCLVAFYSVSIGSGCATILQGRYQDLTINTTPPGAAFEVDGVTGTTPATIPVRRKLKQHVVTISKPGYETAQVSVGRELNAWLIGNIVFGGLPGLGVDFISGGAYKLSMSTVGVDMHQGGSYANQSPANSPTSGAPTVIEAQHQGQRPQ